MTDQQLINLCDRIQANKRIEKPHSALGFWLPKIRWFFSLGYK